MDFVWFLGKGNVMKKATWKKEYKFLLIDLKGSPVNLDPH